MDGNRPVTSTVEFVVDASFAPALGYTFYSVMVPGHPWFYFDLFSVVGEVMYSEENRETIFASRDVEVVA